MNLSLKECILIAFAIAIIVGGPVSCCLLTNKIAIDAGLVEGSLPGQPGTHWVKPEEQKR